MSDKDIEQLVLPAIWLLFVVMVPIMKLLFGANKPQTEKLISASGEVVACKVKLEDLPSETAALNILENEVRNGQFVFYYPIVRFNLNGVDYEAVVQSPQPYKPRLHVPMEILVEADNMSVAYDKTKLERSSLLGYFAVWFLIFVGMCVGIMYLMRMKSTPDF